jgi:hypothetical protein
MSVMTRSLDGAWHITYDSEAKELLVVGDAGERFSVNDFLSLNKSTGAEMELEGLIIDMFPNTQEDMNASTA